MTWQYIAGFFDGEGHVASRYGHKGNYKVSMSQALTRRAVIDAIQAFLDARNIRSRLYFKQPSKTHPRGHVHLVIQDAENTHRFLVCVYRYLIVKQVEALWMIGECDRVLQKRAEIEEKLKPAIEAYKAGYGQSYIWRKFRVTQKRLFLGLKRHGIPIRGRGESARLVAERTKPTEAIDHAAVAYAGGQSLSAAAKFFGVSEHRLKKHLVGSGQFRSVREAQRVFYENASPEWREARKQDIIRGRQEHYGK